MRGGIDRSVPDRAARGVLTEKVVALPVLRGSDRSGNEPAATVRADVVEDMFNARRAECAFISANARFE